MISILILIILTLNFLVVFIVKSKIDTLILTTILGLLLILLFSLSASNLIVLKSLTIPVFIYIAATSFLIISKKKSSSKLISNSKITLVTLTILTIFCTFGSFFFIKNINDKNSTKKEALINQKIIKAFKKKLTINKKFNYLHNNRILNNQIISKFSYFLIIISAIIVFLFLSSSLNKKSAL